MILDSLQSKIFIFLHKCFCQNASLFCWKLVSILKTKRNPSNYLAGRLLQPSIYRWLEQLTSVRCTNDASSAHLSLTSQNQEEANELKDGDWMWVTGKTMMSFGPRQKLGRFVSSTWHRRELVSSRQHQPLTSFSYRSSLHKLSLLDKQRWADCVFVYQLRSYYFYINIEWSKPCFSSWDVTSHYKTCEKRQWISLSCS